MTLDLQTYLDTAMAEKRAKVLAQSDQLTLGEAILKVQAIVDRRAWEAHDLEEPFVRYDFCGLFPTNINSWRGIYSELALNFESEGKSMKVTAFLNMLKSAVGQTFSGYKGGDYTMSRQTPIWVDNYGHFWSTALIDVLDAKYEVILITGYRNSY